jgi:flavin-binding protein dodecin
LPSNPTRNDNGRIRRPGALRAAAGAARIPQVSAQSERGARPPVAGRYRALFRTVAQERRSNPMSDSVYKVIELVGTSSESWEKSARNAVETAAKSLKHLRVAEIVKLDMTVEDGRVALFRARVTLSFKYET